MLEMIKVPKREQRLQGMLFKQLLTGRQEDMRSMTGLINSACLDVRLSRRLKKLLGIILKLGNQLNEVHSYQVPPVLELPLSMCERSEPLCLRCVFLLNVGKRK